MTAGHNFERWERSPFEEEAKQIEAAKKEVAQHNATHKREETNARVQELLQESDNKYGGLF